MLLVLEIRPKEFEAFESIRIYQSVQRDRWELPGGAGNCQRSGCTDWHILIDSNASNFFGLVSCTNHVEKAINYYGFQDRLSR